jgi:GNAT superfamily N-acetyltransferase
VGEISGRVAVKAPIPITADHAVDEFDCGTEPTLNEWLKKRAYTNQLSGASRTFVCCVESRVVGYYCLASGAVAAPATPGRIRRNMPDPIPVVILGRLAVDRRWQGQKLGSAMLRDAVARSLRAAESVGIRAMLIHALSDEAKRFYEKYGFVASPSDPMMLMATMGDLAMGWEAA